jgi:hypothetical protein
LGALPPTPPLLLLLPASPLPATPPPAPVPPLTDPKPPLVPPPPVVEALPAVLLAPLFPSKPPEPALGVVPLPEVAPTAPIGVMSPLLQPPAESRIADETNAEAQRTERRVEREVEGLVVVCMFPFRVGRRSSGAVRAPGLDKGNQSLPLRCHEYGLERQKVGHPCGLAAFFCSHYSFAGSASSSRGLVGFIAPTAAARPRAESRTYFSSKRASRRAAGNRRCSR